MLHRQRYALIVACVLVFVGLFVMNYLDYMKKIQEINYVDWDVKTVTAGDYAIEFDLPDGFYARYIEQYKDAWVARSRDEDNRRYLSDAQGFQLYM